MDSFNTGNLYTVHGQRIAYEQIGDRVAFYDVDRGIWGTVALDGFSPSQAVKVVYLRSYANDERLSYTLEDYDLREKLLQCALQCKSLSVGNTDTQSKGTEMTRKTESKTPALAPVAQVVKDLTDSAVKTIQSEKTESLEEQAKKEFPADRTFQEDGFTYSLEADLAQEMFLAQGSNHRAYGYLRKAEPRISDKGNAPRCYEDKDSVEYKAVTRILQVTNPLWPSAQKLVQELTSQITPLSQQQTWQLAGARGQLLDAGESIKVSRARLKAYYYERQTKPEDSGSEPPRSKPGPDKVLADMCVKLNKRAESKSEVPADARRFRVAHDVLMLVLKDFEFVDAMLARRTADAATAAQVKKDEARTPASQAAIDAAVKAVADAAQLDKQNK